MLAATPANVVQYYVCGRGSTTTAPTTVTGITAGAVTGAVIVYWNYTASPAAPAQVTSGIGVPTTTLTSAQLANNASSISGLAGQTVTIGATTYNTACVAPAS